MTRAKRMKPVQNLFDDTERRLALGHVVEQWQTEERRASDRREQHESDERAQRRVSKT